MKILITGFQKFGNLKVNPTEVFVSGSISTESRQFEILPVSYSESFNRLKEVVERVGPEFILMLGVAHNRELIELEMRADNIIDQKNLDNENKILKNLSPFDEKFTKVDLDVLIQKLNKHFKISKDAGSYLCNFTYYNCLSTFEIPSLFVHIPLPSEYEGSHSLLTQHEIFASLELLITHLQSF